MKHLKLILVLFLLAGLVLPTLADTMQFPVVYDGRISLTGVDLTWPSMSTYAVGNELTTSANISPTLTASGTNNQFATNRRYFLTFDTHTLPAGVTITGVSVYFWGGQPSTQNLGSYMGACLVNSTPINPLGYSATNDYARVSKTALAPCVFDTDWPANTNHTFVMSAYGMAGINRTGNTTLAVISTHDQAEAFNGTWASGATAAANMVPLSGVSGYRPFMVITYTPAGDITPPEAISNLANGTPTAHTASFSWTNPPDADYYQLNLLINGTWMNQSNGTTSLSLTGLPNSTWIFFNSTTEDLSGNRNTTTWANGSTQTAAVDPLPSGASHSVYYSSTNATNGEIHYITGSASFANIRNQPSGTADSSSVFAYNWLYAAGSPANNMYELSRVLIGFNQSQAPIPAGSVMVNGTVTVKSAGSSSGMGAISYGLTGYLPTTNGSIVGADYSRFQGVMLSDNITSPSAGTKTFTLTPAGLEWFKNGGNFTGIMIRDTSDIDNVSYYSWSASANAYAIWPMSEYGPTNIPSVSLYYVAPPAPNFTSNATSGSYPGIHFIDTSEFAPTSWRWSYKNATTGWTVFGTTQNPDYRFGYGTYDINLTATNAAGSNTTTKTGYIISSPSYPLASFSGTPLTGNAPITVTFTDASDVTAPTGFLWDFGDGNATGSTLQNPVHTYFAGGQYTVSETVTNATGSNTMIRTGYIDASLRHPITFNVQNSPGYTNAGIEPWASALTGLNGVKDNADLALTATPSIGSDVRPFYAKNAALYYQITGDTRYANATEYLLSISDAQSSSTSECSYTGDYGQAYDFIYQTKNANSTLDTANDTFIRDRLAMITDYCYNSQNATAHPGNDIDIMSINAKQYPQIALMGEVLADYTNASLSSTPAMWAYLGGDGLWVNDPLHNYAFTTNKGLMTQGVNYQSGALLTASYVNYYNSGSSRGAYMYEWYNIWSNIHGMSYFERYPLAKQAELYMTWQILPMNVIPNELTEGNIVRVNSKLLYNLYDTANQSIIKRSVNLQTLAKNNISLVPGDDGLINAADTYLIYYNISTVPEAQPPYTSVLVKDGWYNVFRKDWSTQSDWLAFYIWKDIEEAGGGWQGRFTPHGDQLSFEYASHGDLLMPDTGEIKETPFRNTYGSDSAGHNAFMIENTTPWVTTGYNANVTFRGIIKYHYAYEPPIVPMHYYSASAGTQHLIKTPYFEYIDGNASLHITEKVPNSVQVSPGYLQNPINYTRAIAYPNKDYPVVIDRATSDQNYGLYDAFRFCSLNLTHATAPNYGACQGTMKISGTPYDWTSLSYAVENPTGVTGNSIQWDTTSLYGDNVHLELFSAPASPITTEKYITRIATYTKSSLIGGVDSVYIPQVYFKPAQSQSLYRVTALLTSYQNETPRTASELAVTGGLGSAIKVVSASGNWKDYIYTGVGNNTFETMNTDADTLFARVNVADSKLTDYTVINGSHFIQGTNNVFSSSVPVTATFNQTSAGHVAMNVSGPSGSATFKFYNMATTPSYVKIDGVAIGTWSMDTPTTLSVTTTLSDHTLEFDGGSGFGGSIPVASFSSNTTIGSSPLSIQFNDTSSNTPGTWNWTFGGANYSALQNPVYTFTGNGYYNVSLVVTNAFGNSSSNQTNYITVTSQPPLSGFTQNATSGTYPVSIQFTDASIMLSPTMWNWSYGDGQWFNTTVSGSKDPIKTYSTGGTYSVYLSVTNASMTNSTTKADLVTIWNQTISNILSDVVTGAVPLSVSFTETSANGTSYLWEFGDTGTSNSKNVTHVYNSPGLYTVNHSVSNGHGYVSTVSIPDYINATSATVPTSYADFSGYPTMIAPGTEVAFTDLSNNTPLAWSWNFGDGNTTGASLQNPRHLYTTDGYYTVSLQVSNGYVGNSSTKTNYINVVQRPGLQNLVMLLHGNTDPASSPGLFLDSSNYFAIGAGNATGTGTANINATQKKFGNASMYSASPADIIYPDASQYTFDVNNFSISGWVYFPTGSAVNTKLFNHSSGANYDSLAVDSNLQISFNRYRSGSTIGSCVATYGTPQIPLNQWNHVAFIQNATYGNLYLNGTLLTTCARTAPMTDIAGPVYINSVTTLPQFNGAHLDELQIFSGGINQTIESLYTSGEYPLYLNGTYGGYADDDYTIMLLHMDGANGGTIFNDEVGNRTWTATGATTTTTSKKFGTASGSFQTGNNVISAPNSSLFDFKASNFTVDFWYDKLSTTDPIYGNIFGTGGSITASGLYVLEQGGHVYAFAKSDGSSAWDVLSNFDLGTVDAPGTWSHYAVVRDGSKFYGFKNGVLTSQTTSSTQIGTSASTIIVGFLTALPSPNALIDEMRVSNVPRWTAGFSSPTYTYELISPLFTVVPSGLSTTGTAQFTDTTPDSTWTNNTYLWYFGDGATSTARNPSHAYTSNGAFTVIENVYNNNMTASTSQIYNVGVPIVDFVGSPKTGTAALQVEFTDLTTNSTPITAYLIDFGDGSTSTALPPWTHVYSTFGTFSVNLTETNSVGTGFEYKRDYIVTSTSQNQQNTWYTPWQVRIRVVDYYGAPLPNTNVTANYVASTLPSTDVSWLISAFGIPQGVATDMVNSAVAMNGTTDDNGGLSFTMFKEIQYRLTIANLTSGVSSTKTLYPSDPEYVIYVRTAGQTANNNTLGGVVNSSLPFYKLNTTHYNLSVIYHDTSGYTTNVVFNVRDWSAGNALVYSKNLGNPGTGIVTDNYTVAIPLGKEYIWEYNATKV